MKSEPCQEYQEPGKRSTWGKRHTLPPETASVCPEPAAKIREMRVGVCREHGPQSDPSHDLPTPEGPTQTCTPLLRCQWGNRHMGGQWVQKQKLLAPPCGGRGCESERLAAGGRECIRERAWPQQRKLAGEGRGGAGRGARDVGMLIGCRTERQLYSSFGFLSIEDL